MSGIYYALAFLPKQVSSDIFRGKTIISALKYFRNTYLWFDLEWHNFLTSFSSFNRLSLKKKKTRFSTQQFHSNLSFGVAIPCLRLSQKHFFKYVKFWSSFVVVVDDKRMSNTGWESLVNLVANVAWVPVVYVHLIVYLEQFRFLGNCPPTPPLSQH